MVKKVVRFVSEIMKKNSFKPQHGVMVANFQYMAQSFGYDG